MALAVFALVPTAALCSRWCSTAPEGGEAMKIDSRYPRYADSASEISTSVPGPRATEPMIRIAPTGEAPQPRC